MNENLTKIKNGQLLEAIREKPAMYLGERSLSALAAYLEGFWMAEYVHEIKADRPLPRDFHDWVAYRLHFFESTSGYKNMILKHIPDESSALDRFFQLLDEYRHRKPRAVARVLGFKKEYTRQKIRDGVAEIVEVGTFPETLDLVAYTDDPGFFVASEGTESPFPGAGRFFPTLRWFGQSFGVRKEDVMVLDPTRFSRWLSEEDRFDGPRA